MNFFTRLLLFFAFVLIAIDLPFYATLMAGVALFVGPVVNSKSEQ